jgi:hypothetical protein
MTSSSGIMSDTAIESGSSLVIPGSGSASSIGAFSHLQHLLHLSYSDKTEDQQKAAVNLAKLVEGTVFPAVSFGPLAHALCRLVPSQNRTLVNMIPRLNLV